MIKRIDRLARGIFEKETPKVGFHTERIDLEIFENIDFSGNFEFESVNDVRMMGQVYSSDCRMECIDTAFEGQSIKISYQFHTQGMVEGDIQKGEFHVIMNDGEYNLPFVVSIKSYYIESSIGRLRTLDDFTRLAQKDMQEAFLIFSSNEFIEFIKKERKAKLLYQAFRVTPLQIQKMEEFLVSINQKEQVTFDVSKAMYRYEQINDIVEDVIEMKKSNWGYTWIDISTDAAFIKLTKNAITLWDFLGSTCNCAFFIDPKYLHAGKNYGKISLTNVYQSIELEIYVDNSNHEFLRKKDVQKDKMVDLFHEYIEFRLQKKSQSLWARDSIIILHHMLLDKPEESWLSLIQAQIFVMNKQRQEAEWILEEQKTKISDKKSALYGYFLYVEAMYLHEPVHMQKVSMEIENIYEETGDTFLFLALLFLQDKYIKNDMAKYKRLKSLFRSGVNSPLIYVELFSLLKQNPYLLEVLDSVEIAVLLWGMRYDTLPKDLANQILVCAQNKKTYEHNLFSVLTRIYETYEDEFSLQIICQYLIKGQCFLEKYLKWYTSGIEHNLKITNLQEAYMRSLDKKTIAKVPHAIQLFYQFESNIPYTQKAVLFVNMIAGKEEEPELYEKYRPMMLDFAKEHLLRGVIDDNLSILYTHLMEENMFTQELMQSLLKVVFYQKLNVFAKDILRVIMISHEVTQVISENISEQMAYLPIYSDQHEMVFEDKRGFWYSNLSVLRSPLMETDRYIRKCIEMGGAHPEFWLIKKYVFFASEVLKHDLVGMHNRIMLFLQSQTITKAYKKELYSEFLNFYEKHKYELKKERVVFLDEIYQDMESVDRKDDVMQALLEEEMFYQAFLLLKENNVVPPSKEELLKICAYALDTYIPDGERFLAECCILLLEYNYHTKELVHFLNARYSGTMKQLSLIYQYSKNYGIDTKDLEERLLIQYLYTKEYIPQIYDIYFSYRKKDENQRLCIAFLNDTAQSYFLEDTLVDDDIFYEIKKMFEKDIELSDVCGLAFLKFASINYDIQLKSEEFIGVLLEEFIHRNMLFSFYQKFDKKLLIKQNIYDRKIIEYKANKKSTVKIHYCIEENGTEYQTEQMQRVYDLIYVWPTVLFFGDEISYYIEEVSDETEITESQRFVNSDILDTHIKGRYDLLNAMLCAKALSNNALLEAYMRIYKTYEHLNEEDFPVL